MRAALFPAVALRDLRAAKEREFPIEPQTNLRKEVATRADRNIAAAAAN
jgi:hypothetical protein